MEKQKMSKIGARCLTENEATAILPTYNKIYEQIELFRKGKNPIRQNRDENSSIEEYSQKTNNIGILGVRGAGKTSVLKTVRQKLIETDKENRDIILPIIIPENMSECSTLMAAILGMINEVVKEREKKEEKEESHKKCIKKEKLSYKFQSVIKQYTFIQKEYRDILIREYTTENDYVKDSAKVFSSDTEFIKRFNELIEELITDSEGLIFLFVDDIDLSTHRCAEVVKTLLSYLSNENIVTFISGDLDTFEEALTLDFLRQEKVLNADMIEKSMLNGRGRQKTLLESKKQLSYEYLKKILPPGYRHNIKQWSLGEKAEYGICFKEDKKEMLCEVLKRTLKGWVDPLFFYYKNEKSGKRIMKYTYHLFDDTSRGLNNVYNVLNEIAEEREKDSKDKEEKDKKYSKEKKQLLDTIIASKVIYNKYRNEIQKNMMVISKNGNKVLFDNAKAFIYGTDIQEDKKNNSIKVLKNYAIEDPVERFSLFILIDFAARLLYEEKYSSVVDSEENYKSLKEKAMIDLLFYPIIAEKIQRASMDKEEYTICCSSAEMTLKKMNMSFLVEGDLLFNLAYYENLPIGPIVELMKENNIHGDQTDIELRQKCIIAFKKAIDFMEIEKENENSVLVNYYPIFWKEIEYIQEQLSSSNVQNIVMNLFTEECKAYGEENKKRILLNTIAELLKDKEKDEINEELNEVNTNNKQADNEQQSNEEQSDNKQSNDNRRINILRAIDNKNLWHSEVVETVNLYLENKIKACIERIADELDKGNLVIETGEAYVPAKEFFESGHGVSETKAKRTKDRILAALNENIGNLQESISYDSYKNIIGAGKDLVYSRAWYGRYEMSKFLRILQQSSVKIPFDLGEMSQEYFVFLLKCSYKYKKARGLTEKARENAEELKNLSELLLTAHAKADQRTLDNFMEELNSNMKEKIISDEFERLFSIA